MQFQYSSVQTGDLVWWYGNFDWSLTIGLSEPESSSRWLLDRHLWSKCYIAVLKGMYCCCYHYWLSQFVIIFIIITGVIVISNTIIVLTVTLAHAHISVIIIFVVFVVVSICVVIRVVGYCRALRRLSAHPPVPPSLLPYSPQYSTDPVHIWYMNPIVYGISKFILKDPVALWNFINKQSIKMFMNAFWWSVTQHSVIILITQCSNDYFRSKWLVVLSSTKDTSRWNCDQRHIDHVWVGAKM